MNDDSELQSLRLIIAHLSGEDLRKVEVCGLMPGADVKDYSGLLGDALRHCWGYCGSPLPSGMTLDDYT